MNGEIRINKAMVESVVNSHTLIAGTTGSGKSVLLNDLLVSLHQWGILYGKPQCLFFDLKRVELWQYKRLRPFCAGYVTEPHQVTDALDWAIDLMEDRYKRMGGRRSDETPLFIVVDELADMLTVKGALERLVKIGRLGRAANVRLLCATQDPSRRTLSAQLMQNFTCCIALRCKTAIESRQIIGVPGAESLPRYGVGILSDPDGVREVEIPFLSDEWLEAYIEAQPVAPAPKKKKSITGAILRAFAGC